MSLFPPAFVCTAVPDLHGGQIFVTFSELDDILPSKQTLNVEGGKKKKKRRRQEAPEMCFPNVLEDLWENDICSSGFILKSHLGLKAAGETQDPAAQRQVGDGKAPRLRPEPPKPSTPQTVQTLS